MTQLLLERQIELIDSQGFNPITGKYMAPARRRAATEHLTEATPLVRALELGLDRCEAEPKTIGDIRSVIGFFGRAARSLRLDDIPVGEIRVIQVLDILDACGRLTKTVKGEEVPKIWNDNQFNYFRKYLSIVFATLKRLEVIDGNPMANIPKRQVIEDPDAVRRTLSADERAIVLPVLRAKKSFWRFINIFYPSGARIAELCRVQGKHVDLEHQRFRVLVKKRRKKAWIWKTITDAALPFWNDIVLGCDLEAYIFSRWLRPGDQRIDPQLITRRWKRLVKDKLGINVDLYSLKHLYLAEIVDELMAEAADRRQALGTAAAIAGHTSLKMTDEVYDTRRDERRHEAAKKRGKGFGG